MAAQDYVTTDQVLAMIILGKRPDEVTQEELRSLTVPTLVLHRAEEIIPVVRMLTDFAHDHRIPIVASADNHDWADAEISDRLPLRDVEHITARQEAIAALERGQLPCSAGSGHGTGSTSIVLSPSRPTRIEPGNSISTRSSLPHDSPRSVERRNVSQRGN